jgi:hypothetical protein
MLRHEQARLNPSWSDQFWRGEKMTEASELTISVPEAGRRYFNMSRGTAYVDIPTIKIGRLLRVPVRALERMLDRASEGDVEVIAQLQRENANT